MNDKNIYFNYDGKETIPVPYGMGLLYMKEDKMLRRNEARVKKAMDIALEQLDYIMDYEVTTDFVEIVGKMGGDVITYRIYDDGTVYERYQEAGLHLPRRLLAVGG